MSKIVTIQLNEAEYRELILCYTLGDLVKDTIEAKSKAEMEAQLDLHQKLFKPAYDAELKEAGLHNGLYYYGKEVENQMLEIYDDFKDYIADSN
jgi:hypothetical protein